MDYGQRHLQYRQAIINSSYLDMSSFPQNYLVYSIESGSKDCYYYSYAVENFCIYLI